MADHTSNLPKMLEPEALEPAKRLLNRRQFLLRAAALGVGLPALGSIAAACAGQPAAAPTAAPAAAAPTTAPTAAPAATVVPTKAAELKLSTDPNDWDPSPSKHGWKVGVCYIALAHPLMATWAKMMPVEAKEQGLELIIKDGQWKVEEQAAALESFVTQKVDGIIIQAMSAAALTPQVKAAEDAGIPVVTLNLNVAYQNIAAVGVYNRAWGRLEGQSIVDALGPTGGEAAIIQGVPDSSGAILFLAGAKDVLEKNPQVKLVAVQPADWDRKKGKEVADALIKANPNLAAIQAQNDEMLMGARLAVEDAGKVGKIHLLGGDGTRVAVEAVEQGLVETTIYQDPWDTGGTSVRIMRFILDAGIKPGTLAEKLFIVSPVFLVTKANVGSIPASKRWG